MRMQLIGLAVAAVCLGGWIYFMRQRAATNQQRMAVSEQLTVKAVAEIDRHGGVTKVEGYERRPPTWLEKLFNDPGPRDDPVRVFKVRNPEMNKPTDAWLGFFVEQLSEDTPLYLYDTNVTDAGLVHLKKLTQLEVLFLVNIKATDAGIKHLQGMTTLRELNLSGTAIGDAGLKYLEGLTNLEELTLYDTNVTDAGVETLQKALPHCKIHPR